MMLRDLKGENTFNIALKYFLKTILVWVYSKTYIKK